MKLLELPKVVKDAYLWLGGYNVLSEFSHLMKKTLKPNLRQANKEYFHGQYNHKISQPNGYCFQIDYFHGRIGEGQLRCGTFNGRQRIIFENGNVHQTVEEDTYFSTKEKGIKILKDGIVYIGSFSSNKLHGNWIKLYYTGTKFEGNYIKGVKWGYGIDYSENGDKFTGFYAHNINKNGTLEWANGDKYTGEFYQGQCSGFGEVLYTNGDRYTGQWKRAKFHGHGKFLASNGTRYHGKWDNGLKHGHGFFIDSDDRVWNEKWRNGACISRSEEPT